MCKRSDQRSMGESTDPRSRVSRVTTSSPSSTPTVVRNGSVLPVYLFPKPLFSRWRVTIEKRRGQTTLYDRRSFRHGLGGETSGVSGFGRPLTLQTEVPVFWMSRHVTLLDLISVFWTRGRVDVWDTCRNYRSTETKG